MSVELYAGLMVIAFLSGVVVTLWVMSYLDKHFKGGTK
jgi:hypothetical protein